MGAAERKRDGKSASYIHMACYLDGTAVELYQVLNKRKADSSAFKCPAFRALHPVEAFEEIRQFRFWNARAGIGNR